MFKIYDENLKIVKDQEGIEFNNLTLEFDNYSQYKRFKDSFNLTIKDEVIECVKVKKYEYILKLLKENQESKEKRDILSCASSSDSECDSDEEFLKRFRNNQKNYFECFQEKIGLKKTEGGNESNIEKNQVLDIILKDWENDFKGSSNGNQKKANISKIEEMSFDFIKPKKSFACNEDQDLNFDQMKDFKLKKFNPRKPSAAENVKYFEDHFNLMEEFQPKEDLVEESYKNWLHEEEKKDCVSLMERIRPRNFSKDEIMKMSMKSIPKLVKYKKSLLQLRHELNEEKSQKIKQHVAERQKKMKKVDGEKKKKKKRRRRRRRNKVKNTHGVPKIIL